MNGLVGIQWGKVCVNLPVILGNMQAVGTDIVIELRLPSFAGVLPADEPDEVLHPGAGHSHHRHWQQSVLARVQGEVDIDLLGRCCAHVTLAIKFGVLVKGIIQLQGALLQAYR